MKKQSMKKANKWLKKARKNNLTGYSSYLKTKFPCLKHN